MADGRLMSRGRRQYNGAGVYVFRGRRPGLFGRVPLIGRHFLYVGMSTRVRSRYSEHLFGSMKYNALPKPWADRKVTWYYVPLPPWKPLLLTVETLLIVCLWPVYNSQKNLWNPRRIPLQSARRQRAQRDLIGWSFNIRPAHPVLALVLTGIAYTKGWL